MLDFEIQEPSGDVRVLKGTYVNSKGNRRTINYKQKETVKQ